MMNWAKKTLASVAGTPEPIYGPSAVCSVDTQTAETPYTELTKKDLTWQVLDVTSVETQTFYIFTPAGHIGMAQIIYSNVSNIKTTVQFNSKIFYPKSEDKPHLWCSDALSNVDFDEDKTSFYADNVALELSEDGNSYTIKSMVNEESFVDLTITRDAPGFMVGKDGKTTFGTDLANPWGSVSHFFWPRNTCKGTIVTKDGPIDFGGQAIFIMALQGMKPHHAAAKWNFVNFHGPNISAVMMEFTTPPSYGSTKVTVGGIAKDGEIICAGSSNTVEHTTVKGDAQNDWPEPETVKFVWAGKTKDGKDVHAIMEGPLDERIDKVDVLAHVPGFIKQIAAGAAGTKPYIYQFSPKEISLKLKIGDQETVESGRLFSEATFVCP